MTKKKLELIDLHVHGIGKLDTSTSHVDDIIEIAMTEKSNGISGLVLSIYPDEIGVMRSQLEVISKAMGALREDCADIIGVHLEGPFLNPLRAGALNKAHFLVPSISSLRSIIDGYEDIIRIVTIAPELRKASDVIRFCRDRGIKVNMGHSDATYREALRGKNAGATGITHIFNAMRPMHHREPGLAGFGLLDDDTYVEIIADGVHLDLNTLKLIFSVKPSNRLIIISDAVKGRRSAKKAVYLKDGTIAGSCITLSESIDLLIKNGFDPETVRMAASANPLRYIN
ncbi:MAG: hypothetical protein JSV21_00805 [Nitrospirota bacterium]|nr:MAG: hypothetical protein JSV21_00805 [Nitrospirota bacterium]